MAVKKIDKLQVVRPLDKVEQFHSARHKLGLFYASIITARYSRSLLSDDDAQSSWSRPIYTALASLVRKQAFLRVGIAQDELSKPAYIHLSRVSLHEQVDSVTIAADTRQEYDEKLLALLMQRHDQPWQNMTTRPPWRLTLVTRSSTVRQNGNEPLKENQYDLIFAYHHSLMDANSGCMFHEQLLPLLNERATLDTEPEYTLEFGNTTSDLPPSRDEVLPTKVSKRFIGKAVWHEFAPKAIQKTPTPWWSSRPIDFALPRKTRLITKEIAAADLAALLQASRKHGTTMSGLIHALTLASLARRISPEDAVSFHSLTPIDYRRLVSEQVPAAIKKIFGATMANCVTVEEQKHDRDALAAARAPMDMDSGLRNAIWSQAKEIGGKLAEQRSRLPVNDLFKIFKYVPDWDELLKNRDGKQRDHSWELSNVGAIKVPRLEEEDDGVADSAVPTWRITRACFSSSAQPVGTAFAIRAVSVPGGPLCITLIWQEGSVAEDIAEGLASDLWEWAVLLGGGSE